MFDSHRPKLTAEADAGRTGFASLMAWQASGDMKYIDALHAEGLQSKVQRAYMNTDGHWWSDRVEAPSEFLQRARLGGIALKRNQSWPGHTVSWRFDRDGAAEQVALLVHAPSRERFTVTSYNLGARTIAADMTGWNVASGTWRIRSGVDTNGDGRIDGTPVERSVKLETSASVPMQFRPGRTEVFEFERVSAGTAVETRADLGVGRGDLHVDGRQLQVTVHSLGHVGSGVGVAVLEDARGREIARTEVPAMAAPTDLQPKTVRVLLPLPAGDRSGLRVRVALADGGEEVTRLNNVAAVPQ